LNRLQAAYRECETPKTRQGHSINSKDQHHISAYD